MFCTRCGTANNDAARFCSGCGADLSAGGGAAGTTAPPVSPPAGNFQAQGYPAAGYPPPGYQAPPAGYIYAGFWRRFAALFVDSLLVTPLAVVAAVVLGLLFGITMHGASELDPFRAAAFVGAYAGMILVIVAGNWLYHTLMESSTHQATLGKKVLGLVVTDTSGNRISFARANGRFFGKILSGLILNIGYIMAAFTPRKQALHDMIADCLVLKRL